MYGILFICHGNICRSPTAEMILKDMANKCGAAEQLRIESRATSTEEISGGIGNPIYPPAKRELERHGIPCGNKRAQLLKQGDAMLFDLLICMDQANMRNALRIIGSDPGGKLHLLTEYSGRNSEIADPWYTGNYDLAFREIYAGCAALMRTLARENKMKSHGFSELFSGLEK